MILYHFSTTKCIDGIKKEGLTKGKTPFFCLGEIDFIRNTQWLTTNGNPNDQRWAIRLTAPYSRNEFRVKVKIPEPYLDNLRTFGQVCEFLKNWNVMVPNFDKGGLDDTWYVYCGQIPRKWLRNIRSYKS